MKATFKIRSFSGGLLNRVDVTMSDGARIGELLARRPRHNWGGGAKTSYDFFPTGYGYELGLKSHSTDSVAAMRKYIASTLALTTFLKEQA
jgi:hypothetical protein